MSPFELYLFYRDAETAAATSQAGAAGLVVDWEWEGKEARQAGSDTEINRHTQEDLRAARGATKGRILCRINRVWEGTADEVKAAIEGGADERCFVL